MSVLTPKSNIIPTSEQAFTGDSSLVALYLPSYRLTAKNCQKNRYFKKIHCWLFVVSGGQVVAFLRILPSIVYNSRLGYNARLTVCCVGVEWVVLRIFKKFLQGSLNTSPMHSQVTCRKWRQRSQAPRERTSRCKGLDKKVSIHKSQYMIKMNARYIENRFTAQCGHAGVMI